MSVSTLTLYPAKPNKVYLFGTCLIDLFYPSAGMAAVALLEKANIEVVYPYEQSCCGQPAYTSGFKDEAKKVALAQMALFKDDIPILIPSGSCAGMMKIHYPRLFANSEYEADVLAFSRRIYEVSDFLVKVCDLTLDDAKEPEQVVLHTSCSSRREMESTASGISLLETLSNVTVVEPDRAKECCGFGGAFSVRQPHISTAMAEDKVLAINMTHSDAFVSTDCGCLMNLQGLAKKQNTMAAETQQAVVAEGEHILSFIARRAGLLTKEDSYEG